MHILYFGDHSPGSTSAHRAAALCRLGHVLTKVDPVQLFPEISRLQSWLHYRSGYRFLQKKLLRALSSIFDSEPVRPDVVWVDSGEYFGPKIISNLRAWFNAPVLLFNVDDPTGTRDWIRFTSLRAALPIYNICICVRPETQLDMLALGAPSVMRVWRSYDEVEHASLCDKDTSPGTPELITCAVFVGTYIPGENRDRFLLRLAVSGLPVRIFGNRWHRSPFYSLLRDVLLGTQLKNQAYANVLHSAGVSLGMLSHLNRDLHTQRSLEVPYAKGALCAERTSEHQLLYEDGVEALLWDSWVESFHHCSRLLADPFVRESLVTASHTRVLELGVGNEDVCRQVLATL